MNEKSKNKKFEVIVEIFDSCESILSASQYLIKKQWHQFVFDNVKYS